MRSFRLPLWIVAFIAAFTAHSTFAQAPPALKPVVLADVIEHSVTPRQTFVGVVKPARRSIIGSAVDGRVETMLVDVGGWVQMPADGTPAELALLRTVTINIEIAAAEAELEFRNHELAEMKSSRPEEIASAEARMSAAEAIMKFATEKSERDRRLYEQGRLVSEEDYRRSLSVATEASKLYEAAKSQHQMMLEGPRVEKRNQMEARVKIQEQEINRLRDRLEKYAIKAPFSGYVVAKHTEVGAWVKSGDPVVEMIELDPAEILVSVPEDSIADIQPGMTANVSVSSLPWTNVPGGALPGKVIGILPDADPRTRTYSVRVHVHNPSRAEAAARKSTASPALTPRAAPAIAPAAGKTADPGLMLKSGMLARVDLQIAPIVTGARLVPKDAVVVNGPLRQIIVFRPQPTAEQPQAGVVEPMQVQTGVTDGSTIEIVSPVLAPGTLVVIEGNERLRKGEAVDGSKRKSTAALISSPAK